MCKAIITFHTLVRVQHMPFKFVTEVTDGGCHGPGCSIAQRADGIAFDLTLYIPQQVYITHFSFAVFYVVQHAFHPAGAFAAGAALSAAFMMIEAGQRQGMAYYA